MTRAKRILLVEDNADDVALTVRAFRHSQLDEDIRVARDGVEAVEALLGSDGAPPGDLPALVLLDLKLPRLDGFDVLRRIRGDTRTRRLPVVILSSSAERVDVSHAYDLGANSYVRKPVSFDEFLDVVRQIGDYWLALNEPPAAGP